MRTLDYDSGKHMNDIERSVDSLFSDTGISQGIPRLRLPAGRLAQDDDLDGGYHVAVST